MHYILNFGGFLSFNFIGRFVIALLILWFLHNQNKDDKNITRGMRALITIFICVMFLGFILFLLSMVFGGLGLFLSKFLSGFSYSFRW